MAPAPARVGEPGADAAREVSIKEEPDLDASVWVSTELACVPQHLCVKEEATCAGPESVCVKEEATCAGPESVCVKEEATCADLGSVCVKEEATCAGPESVCVKEEATCADPGSVCVKEEPMCVQEVLHVEPEAPCVKEEASCVRPPPPARVPPGAPGRARAADAISTSAPPRARVSGDREREIAMKQLSETIKSKKTYTCDICKANYRKFPNFVIHKQLHVKNKIKRRDKTAKKYRVDPAPFKNTYACDICKEEYNSLAVLTIHKQVHATETRSKYKTVGSSTHSSTLQSTESPKNTHSCTICKAGFNDHVSLKKHSLIFHGTTEHMYTCETCHMKYATKRALEIHNRVHEDARRYSCEHCKERFRQTSDLHRHKLIWHAKFSCAGCETKQALQQLKQMGKLRETDSLTRNTDLCDRCNMDS